MPGNVPNSGIPKPKTQSPEQMDAAAHRAQSAVCDASPWADESDPVLNTHYTGFAIDLIK